MDELMPETGSVRETLITWAYAVAAIAGAAGGCTVAAHNILRGRPMASMIIAAYSFVGGVFGVAGVSAMYLFSDLRMEFEKLFLIALGFGLVGSLALAGANLSARFMFKRLGIQVDMNVKRIERRRPRGRIPMGEEDL